MKALAREGQVFSDSQASVLDASVELLAHLQTSSPSAAVAGGWAAIEALLGEHSNRTVAADRLAMLVTCSFPRAELTLLAYAIEKRGGDLADELKVAPTNRDKAAVVQRAIEGGRVNLVLHWGRTDAVGLRATLRTASPLVGAGFDRIVHAHYVEKLAPLELVARARTALATVGASRGPSCVDLLA